MENEPKRELADRIAIRICRFANGHEGCDCHNLRRVGVCGAARLEADAVVADVCMAKRFAT